MKIEYRIQSLDSKTFIFIFLEIRFLADKFESIFG